MQIPAQSTQRADFLVEAFRATEYVVDAPGGDIVVRIGQHSPTLDALLGGRCWAVITAHNPNGVRRRDDDNAQAQRALENCLGELRPAQMLQVCNHDPSAVWPDEPAWLLTCQDISAVDGLARRFGQRAVVSGRPGEPATLRMYDEARNACRSDSEAVS